ncbi:enoyl-CoA hydratase/isomerase family protein [Dactylosporangium sp. CA-233914]|uniref:enoyl-CoA hydratase/isomerase family protein n=1 Tax=Dactylosporangium sp. CA-233914 TaxID=3239934 RepID=UPI003D8F2D8D
MVVRYSRADHVAFLTLDNAPTNVIDHAWLDAFEAALDSAERDDRVKVLVVRSAQQRFFCGGADVNILHRSSADENLRFVRRVQETFDRLESAAMLCVAVIEGHATGGGYELALACDIRMAAAGTYRIGLPEAVLGLLPAGGGTQRLQRLVGTGRALSLMCTGKLVGPAEATRLGLVDLLAESSDIATELDTLTRPLATIPAEALAAIKRCVIGGQGQALAAGLEIEAREIYALFHSDETRSRISAFVSQGGAAGKAGK